MSTTSRADADVRLHCLRVMSVSDVVIADSSADDDEKVLLKVFVSYIMSICVHDMLSALQSSASCTAVSISADETSADVLVVHFADGRHHRLQLRGDRLIRQSL